MLSPFPTVLGTWALSYFAVFYRTAFVLKVGFHLLLDIHITRCQRAQLPGEGEGMNLTNNQTKKFRKQANKRIQKTHKTQMYISWLKGTPPEKECFLSGIARIKKYTLYIPF